MISNGKKIENKNDQKKIDQNVDETSTKKELPAKKGNRVRRPKKHSKRFPNGSTPPKVDEPKVDPIPKSNDGKWYSNDSILFEQATKIQTMHINGLPYRLGLLHGLEDVSYNFNPDGIIRVDFDAQIAGSRKLSDPLNRSMLNLFNVIRGKYTSTVPFGPVDLTAYFISIGSVLSLISHIKNCLDWVNTYDAQNAQVPALLLESVLTASSLIHESTAYGSNVFNLNVQIARLASLAIPEGINYLERCSWLGRKLYYEDKGSGMRGNLIYFNPHTLYTFTNEATTKDGKLKGSGLQRVVVETRDINKMIIQLSHLITALVNDDNIRQMSGWIYTYLEKIKKVSYVITYATKEPADTIYDDEVIDIIQNCKLVHCEETGVTQFSDDSSYIIDYSSETNNFTSSSVDEDHVVIFPEQATKNVLMRFFAKPTADQIMIASRMAHTWTLEEDGIYYLDCDMFTVSNIMYTFWDRNHAKNSIPMNTYYYSGRPATPGEYPTIYPSFEPTTISDADLQILGGFNILPARYVCEYDITARGFKNFKPIQNVDFNFELLSDDLHNLNTVAVLSQFNFKAFDNSDGLVNKN